MRVYLIDRYPFVFIGIGRFLLALDLLAASALTVEEAADESRAIDLRRYLQALQRRAADREGFVKTLVDLGVRVHRIPSLSDEEVSINYINGVHDSSAYMMPVFGAFYGALDSAAHRAMSEAFGGRVRIKRIGSADVQIRYGGLHCIVATYPWIRADEKNRPPPAEARSLLGRPLYPVLPGPKRTKLEADLEAARADLAESPPDPARIVWVGRRLGYLWRINEAIEVYSEGIKAHPDYAPLYRHRGHRYISIRQFDNAIVDLEHAARLIKDKPDKVEPDGMPNAANIPLTTTGFNVWYHLALARYLKGDYAGALEAWQETMKYTGGYDDNIVAVTDWTYMTLRHLGRERQAAELIEAISPDMEIIENFAYHQRLLMYKGLRKPADLLDIEGASELDLATLGYGVALWYMESGERDKGVAVFERLVAGRYWPAFGFIAAEVELARLRR